MTGWPKANKPFGVMGIVNVTPDSFYDGGKHASPHDAVQAVHACLAAGADIVDLGAESSRPGSSPVSAAEEAARLLPVLMALRQNTPCTLSVDTWRASTAALALQQGVAIINDISACQWDAELLDVLVQYKPGYVLMHCQGHPKDMQAKPHYDDVFAEVRTFFERELNRLVRAGLPEDCIVLDPGIGFGKTVEHNIDLLARVGELREFGRPLLVGLSMKSLFGHLLGLPPQERAAITQTATALLRQKGVFWHRVHHVEMAVHGLRLAMALENDTCWNR